MATTAARLHFESAPGYEHGLLVPLINKDLSPLSAETEQTSMTNYADAECQASMVLDSARTSAYEMAIRDVVRAGDVVMDVGSGSGILALFAARAGAKKVYAIECTDAAQFIREHAKENGFEDIIEVIRADILDLEGSDISENPNVVVSEMLGNFAPGEDLHAIYQKAHSLARADAIFIPSSYRMIVGAARPYVFEEYAASLKNLGGLSLNNMLQSIVSKVSYRYLQPEELVSGEVEGPDILCVSSLPERFSNSVTITKDGLITAIAVSFRAILTPEIGISTAVGAPGTHWPQTILPIYPALSVHEDETLEVEIVTTIVTDSSTWRWSVAKNDELHSYGRL